MKEATQTFPTENEKTLRNQVFNCIQCGYCSSFCEVSFIAEDTPRKIIRFLQCNDTEEAVKSPFLRLCKQCLTCTRICPQGVDVAEIMRRLVRKRFIKN